MKKISQFFSLLFGNVKNLLYLCSTKEKDMEIFRANFDKWVWDDAYGSGHTEHIEIGFYSSRDLAERELYLYISQRIKGIDKEKTKKYISQSSKSNKIIINKYNYYWIESIEVK